MILKLKLKQVVSLLNNSINRMGDTIQIDFRNLFVAAVEDEQEIEHDYDDEDEDVVSILSNSKMNAKRLLELKSDPILEKYNDDDSSSSDSDDSLQNELNELEAKYSFIKKKMDEYRGMISLDAMFGEKTIQCSIKSLLYYALEIESNLFRIEELKFILHMQKKPFKFILNLKKKRQKSLFSFEFFQIY